MHPYEMATTMRQRGKHESIKLNYGSLYTVVQSLSRAGMIAAHETEREGRRPERTVYTLLDAGRIELIDWLSELLSTPAKEFTQFEAALSLLPCLPPDDALGLLVDRVRATELELVRERSTLAYAAARGIPRLFCVEGEYRIAMREAELAYTNELVNDIQTGAFESLELWSGYHRPSQQPPKQLPESGLRKEGTP